MKRIKILVVEDEVIVADHLCSILQELGYETIDVAKKYTEAFISINQERPDLVILDIQLSGKKSGIDIAKSIRENYDLPFIFLTSNADVYTVEEAKSVKPPAFLVKPFSKQELYSAVEITLSNFKKEVNDTLKAKEGKSIFIKTKNGIEKIELNDLLYIKSMHLYLDLVLVNNKSYIIRKNMRDILLELSDNFVRTHRSYIVNTEHIQSFDGRNVVLLDVEIPVSKKYKSLLLNKLKIL